MRIQQLPLLGETSLRAAKSLFRPSNVTPCAAPRSYVCMCQGLFGHRPIGDLLIYIGEAPCIFVAHTESEAAPVGSNARTSYVYLTRNIAPFMRNVKGAMLDPAFRAVNTLFPIYVPILIDTTYPNNRLHNTRQQGEKPSSRTYCMTLSLFDGRKATMAPTAPPRHLVMVNLRLCHKQLRVLRMRSYWCR